MKNLITIGVSILLAVLLLPTAGTRAQGQAPCGIADQLDFPIDNLFEDTLARGWDDFAMFRQRFGGRHLGLDIAFRQQGRPIAASARGRVTYSDIEGWDTEKGVVILEHFAPWGERFYTLYGHIEETDDVGFPPVGRCVERGEVIGVVGIPTLSLPHLHYEIRRVLPNDGGPGYTTGNPIAEGWYHPLDFTAAYALRLNTAYVSSLRLVDVPGTVPLRLPDGGLAIGSGPLLSLLDSNGAARWRINMAGDVIGIAALPGGRIVAQSEDGQVAVLLEGRYQAVWRLEGVEVKRRFAGLDETLIFAAENGSLLAYDSTGELLWTRAGSGTPLAFEANGRTVSMVSRASSTYHWRILDAAGEIIYETREDVQPVPVIAPDGSWLAVSRDMIQHLPPSSEGEALRVGVSLPGQPQAAAVDTLGRSYAYLNSGMLVSIDSSGSLRWQVEYPRQPGALPLAPRLLSDGGCALFALDASGALYTFSASDGTLLDTQQLYAGGARTRSPQSRLLSTDGNGRLYVGAGFLSVFTFDLRALAAPARQSCVLG
jgi:murein DD-endopeptidase MepM/ murein hydrolase activator NlpD